MRGTRFLALGAAVACGIATASRADVWTAEPQVAIGAEYASNPAVLLAGDHGQAVVLNGSLPLEWHDGVQHLTVEPKVRLGKSGGASPLGEDGYYLNGTYRLEWPRLSVDATSSFANDSGIIRQPDAGTLMRLPVRERGDDSKLSLSYDLTERDSLSASTELRRQRYGIRAEGLLYDFDYVSNGARYTRLTGEKHAVFLSASQVRYTLPTVGYGTESQEVSVGATGVVAEVWQYQFTLGQSHLSTTQSTERPTGKLYVAQLDRAGERLHLTASAIQSLQPSGFGTLVLSRDFNARIEYGLSQRLRVSLSGRRALSTDLFYTFALTQRRYDRLLASAEWSVSDKWNAHLDGNYQRGSANGLFSQQTAGHSFGIYVGLVRHFARFSLH